MVKESQSIESISDEMKEKNGSSQGEPFFFYTGHGLSDKIRSAIIRIKIYMEEDKVDAVTT